MVLKDEEEVVLKDEGEGVVKTNGEVVLKDGEEVVLKDDDEAVLKDVVLKDAKELSMDTFIDCHTGKSNDVSLKDRTTIGKIIILDLFNFALKDVHRLVNPTMLIKEKTALITRLKDTNVSHE